MELKKYSKLLGIGLIGMSTQFATPLVSNSQELCPKGFQLVMSGDRNGMSEKCVRIAELAERDPDWYREDGELMFSKVHYKIEQAPTPKKGINFSYGTANAIVGSWTESELNAAVAELDGIPKSRKDTIKGMLKYWPLIKFHAEQVGKQSRRILDPRDVAHIMFAENAGYSSMRSKNPVRGAAGEGTLMQIIPSTAKFMYKLHSRHYKYYEKGKPHHLGINGLINGMFFALDGKSAFGIERLNYDEISPERLAKLYDFYNKANTKERIVPTWQIENFAECSKYMFAYDFLESKTTLKLERIQLASRKKAETKVAIADSVKKQPEHAKSLVAKPQAAKKPEIKKVPVKVADVKVPTKTATAAGVKSETILTKPSIRTAAKKTAAVSARPIQTAGRSNAGTSEVKNSKGSIKEKNDIAALREELNALSEEILKLRKQVD